ncbi:DUF2530 domain-containing protein [Streptomyces sp. NEAU-W12]|uniref:DUF2530 domain-containing protein n=1 Tax=Streptomyces sp. NEAU-W12 TaxID=2994668 RepID=UPI00224B5FFE|nr:DUF2530 domain-containing protein [Streptomyces sp. NEAU-W12]MCX2925671.1 DUF2530 domain-containing protein [Streptomyces sp. NEAU-W12]
MVKGTPKHEAPEPLEGPVVATVVGGTLVWFALFLVQLPFYGWLDDHGHTWWLWTCLAGGGLGFIGIWYVRRRESAIRRARAGQAVGSTDAPEAEPLRGPSPASPTTPASPASSTD